METDGSGQMGMNNSAGGLYGLPISGDGSKHIWYLKGGPSLTYVENNSRTVISNSNNGGITTSNQMTLFGRNDDSGYANIIIGELVYGAGTLTSPQEESMWTYLKAKWSVA